eukprot:435768-Rhodomonas_salina.1
MGQPKMPSNFRLLALKTRQVLLCVGAYGGFRTINRILLRLLALPQTRQLLLCVGLGIPG